MDRYIWSWAILGWGWGVGGGGLRLCIVMERIPNICEHEELMKYLLIFLMFDFTAVLCKQS